MNLYKIFRFVIKAISTPLAFLVLFFVVSMFVYKNLEKDITWIDAFFWITHPHAISEHRSNETKIFAFIVYVGILFFQVWFIERILVNVFSGELKILWRKRMSEVAISKLKEHYIICGYGQVGRTVVDELIKLGLPFVLIETNESIVRELLKEGLNVIHGDARRRSVLLSAGIEQAKFICTLIDNDADNLYITITAKMLNPKIKVISRAGNLRYAEAMKGAGADEVVVPEYEGGMVVGRIISRYEKLKGL
ncbi:TrkA-N domain-containing protein [Candidatus Thermokryptus mobilis]|uniref:TrkA-N domain-containing protein n=1 Tax=Candidatus Thermokryptus mobilis TaxID=1643428 RepID=A0A0S4N570_9BACT|nr:NAD(P)-binding protein [Candidatus Thermokryptus mobilis]CUU05169.1 TrkA-N domain-containing protein [Candidatus Thermokryptus mobilis]